MIANTFCKQSKLISNYISKNKNFYFAFESLTNSNLKNFQKFNFYNFIQQQSYPLITAQFQRGFAVSQFSSLYELQQELFSIAQAKEFDIDYVCDYLDVTIDILDRVSKISEHGAQFKRDDYFLTLLVSAIRKANEAKDPKKIAKIMEWTLVNVEGSRVSSVAAESIGSFERLLSLPTNQLHNILIAISNTPTENNYLVAKRILDTIEPNFSKVKTEELIFLLDNCNKIFMDYVLKPKIVEEKVQDLQLRHDTLVGQLVPIVENEVGFLEPTRLLEAANLFLQREESNKITYIVNQIIQRLIKEVDILSPHYLIMLSVTLMRAGYDDSQIWYAIEQNLLFRIHDLSTGNLVNFVAVWVQARQGSKDLYQQIADILVQSDGIEHESLLDLVIGFSMTGADCVRLYDKITPELERGLWTYQLSNIVGIYKAYSRAAAHRNDFAEKLENIFEEKFKKLSAHDIKDLALANISFGRTEMDFFPKIRKQMKRDLKNNRDNILDDFEACAEIYMTTSQKGDFLFEVLPYINEVIPSFFKQQNEPASVAQKLELLCSIISDLTQKDVIKIGDTMTPVIQFLHDSLTDFMKQNAPEMDEQDYLIMNSMHVKLKDHLRYLINDQDEF